MKLHCGFVAQGRCEGNHCLGCESTPPDRCSAGRWHDCLFRHAGCRGPVRTIAMEPTTVRNGTPVVLTSHGGNVTRRAPEHS
eukprot:7952651-Lingulodinium_polyedra.AAC.1